MIDWERRESLFGDLIEYSKNGDWEKIRALTFFNPDMIAHAFLFLDRMPESFKRMYVLETYAHCGNNFPCCRAAVRKLEKRGLLELPKKYRNREYITVYRAGSEPISKAPWRISWTLKKETAEKFLNGWSGCRATRIYEGKIRPADVIAYYDGRKEKEILQYRKVFDVKEVTQV